MGLLPGFIFYFYSSLYYKRCHSHSHFLPVRHIGFLTCACAIPAWVQEKKSLFLSWTLRKFVQTKLKWKLDKTESIEQCKAISRHVRGLYWVQIIFHDVMHWSISWFSHDITKIQTKKLSLLLSFYFHVVLQHLNTNKFSVQKGSLFCDTGRLNFRVFVWHGI